MCVLEVAASLTVAPQVADATLERHPDMADLVALLRQRSAVAALAAAASAASAGLVPGPGSPSGASMGRLRASGASAGSSRTVRERTHLLYLYPALVECVALQGEQRLTAAAQGLLRQVGTELGLGFHTEAT